MKHIAFATSAIAAALLFAPGAKADTEQPSCTISTVGINVESPPGRQFFVTCSNDGQTYIAYQTQSPSSPGCPLVDADALKEYESMAVAARLANKTLDIWWNTFTCAGSSVRVIMSMQIH